MALSTQEQDYLLRRKENPMNAFNKDEEPQGLRLKASEYNVPCENLAKGLLGLYLCRQLTSGEILKGIIIETECYPGGTDKASHSFDGKRTDRNEPMYMSPGTAYVYSTYGMYFCFNISSQGDGAAVLIRALEPICGFEAMRVNRESSRRSKVNPTKRKKLTALDLCNGPSKLCMSFAIDKSLNKEDMVKSTLLWIERPLSKISEQTIISCPRIGIDSVGVPWASLPLRFYIKGNLYLSKRDKKAEEINQSQEFILK